MNDFEILREFIRMKRNFGADERATKAKAALDRIEKAYTKKLLTDDEAERLINEEDGLRSRMP